MGMIWEDDEGENIRYQTCLSAYRAHLTAQYEWASIWMGYAIGTT